LKAFSTGRTLGRNSLTSNKGIELGPKRQRTNRVLPKADIRQMNKHAIIIKHIG
jgi:hypothetical protein